MKNVSPKPKIALIGMSVMGGGTRNNGIPVLVDLFERLSDSFEITFYSFQPVHRPSVPASIRVVDSKTRIPGRLNYMRLISRISMDHLLNPYDLFFAVSVYPPAKAAVLLGRIFRRPVITQIIALEAVAVPEINFGNLTIPWLAEITRRVCARTTWLVAVSEYQALLAREHLPTSRHIDVLPLRINPEKFTFRQRVITFPVQFIHIAYYSPVKDQDMMFRAFAKVSQKVKCFLTVIGEGFNVDGVTRLLQELGISDKVILQGFVPQENIPGQFDGKHILLHTARFETGCAVIQEAMASGVAVCGTRVGLLSDIRDDLAISVDPGNDGELAMRILQLIGSPALFSSMTLNAWKWISEFDARWAAENYRHFISSRLLRPEVNSR
jgi:glycosyltransferase involved in cell wall biosynthesis